MENLSHSTEQSNVSHASVPTRACNGGSFAGKNAYDDVLGGRPRFGATALSPRPEDYREIFRGFHASRVAIPVLDLPMVDEEELFFDFRSSGFDYSEVFGGFDGLDFASSFEELMRQAHCGGDRDRDGKPSEEAWSPAETECLSEESDHSRKDRYPSSGDSYEPVESSMEFSMSYHKSTHRSNQDMNNGITHVAELHSFPEYAHVFEETIPLDKTHVLNPQVHVTSGDVNLEFSGGRLMEKHLSKMLRPSNGTVDEVKAANDLESQRGYRRNGSYSDQMFVTISEISLRTQPSELPPPSRPPPMLGVNKGDCINSQTTSPKERMGNNSPPYLDVEIDAGSAAAASAAAMKEAMENAQAKLRSAKELLERKRDGVQTHKRVASKYGGMDQREKVTKDVDGSSDMDDEPLQRACEKGKSEKKISVAEDGRKVVKTTQTLPDSIEGEKHFRVTKRYTEEKHGSKSWSSKGVYNNEADEWQEEAQFFELVRTDKLSFEQVGKGSVLLKNSKMHEPQQKAEKVAMEALKQQREIDREVTTVREDHDLEKIERDLRLAKEAYRGSGTNGWTETEKQAVQFKVNEKKFGVHQDVSKLEENAKKSRATRQRSDRGKKIPEADELENLGRIEIRLAENEIEIEEVGTCKTNDDPTCRQKHNKFGEMPERGDDAKKQVLEWEDIERKLGQALQQSENEKLLKKSLEQEEKERTLKEVRRREEKKKKEKEAREREAKAQKEGEACDQEKKEKKDREACEREEKRKREREALEREEREKKEWEALEVKENEKNERELQKREEQKNKEREAREKEEKRKREELEQEEQERKVREACRREEEKGKIVELKREEQKRKERETCKREEEQKRKERETCKREEQERKKREAHEQEEEEKKEREGHEQEENERKEKELHELEESERIWRMALEQLENEKRLKQTVWHSESGVKTREAPEQEELGKKQNEAYEKEENSRKSKQTTDKVKNEKQQKESDKGEGIEKRHKVAHEKATNKGLEEACGKEDTGRRHKEVHERDGIEKMQVIEDKHVRRKETLDGENEKKSEEAFTHEEMKEVKGVNEVYQKFQREQIGKNAKAADGNDLHLAEKGLEVPVEALEPDNNRKSQEDDVSDLQFKDNTEKKFVGDEIGFKHRSSEKIMNSSRVGCDPENMVSKFANECRGKGKNSKQAEAATKELGNMDKFVSIQALKESVETGRTAEITKSFVSDGKLNNQKISRQRQVNTSQTTEKKDSNMREIRTAEEKEAGRIKRERELEMERLRKLEEEREREREREKDRMAVDRVALEAHGRAYAESRERAAMERATAEARHRKLAKARERLEKACAEAREKSYKEARFGTDRTTAEKATAEVRERALEKTMAERAAAETRERIERSKSDKFSSSRNNEMRTSSSFSDLKDHQFQRADFFGGSRFPFSPPYNGMEGESAQRCKARLERYQRTTERAAKALEEKNMRDLLSQREQAERHRLAETLAADVKRWSNGKEGNLRALLSTLQYILGPDSGWQPIPLTEVITSAAVKKAYRKATLCVHPDKLQQRGASIQQKYICEKVFDLLKEAWNKFNSEER